MTLLDKHIVIIDDTESIRTFLRVALEAQGAKFDGAATAAGGLAMCESKNPDLVILDLGLPDHEGFDILPRLKKRPKLIVIVLTVRNDSDSLKQAIELGADAYVTKPFNVGNLLAIIEDKLQ